MFFRQVIDANLGRVSYVIADAGKGIVVDPSAAIDQYLELACRHDFGIAHIVETSAHPGHASGTRDLVELTGATLWRAPVSQPRP
jgi:hydroxyacylglutathione hydrolase